jgi:uncharacterized BrkB/YihY/UPF0761 family membrane protein
MTRHSNEKQKRIQEMYRKKKREGPSSKTWTLLMILCVIPVLFLIVMSALFDLGIQLPELFGR